MQLLIALLILGLGWYGLKFFARASPRAVARMVKLGGGALAGVVGLGLLLRGRPDLGVVGIGAGLWLAGFFKLPSRGSRPSGATGRSQARSATIEMTLDHASGALTGVATAGPFAGRALDSLSREELASLFRACLSDDPDGARLLEPYLDRRFAGWREAGEAQADAGRAAGGRRAGLSEQEAYEILGLAQGAARDEVVRAHRTLMKKLHPDHGGSTALAARVNEAKDVLLRRDR